MRLLVLGLFAIGGLSTVAAASQLPPPAIAVLEDYPDTQFVKSNIHRISYEPRVRAAFIKQPSGWQPVCDEDKPGNASRCPASRLSHFSKLYKHHPNRIEEVNTSGLRKPESCCSGVGWLQVVSKFHVTHDHGDRLLQFGGHMHEPVLKPEVLFNQREPVQDPVSWTPTLESEFVPRVQEAVGKVNGDLLVCRTGDSQAPRRVDVPWKSSHLNAVERYKDRNGNALVKAVLSTDYDADCKSLGGNIPDMGIARPEFWIAVSNQGGVVVHVFRSKINAFAKLQLLRFGDFDGDGTSEALFFRSGYNEDGYELFHEGMKKTVKFTWGYH